MGLDLWQTFERNKQRHELRRRNTAWNISIKDILVVTTSTAAFIMSAVTTYLTSFRELDDVRVVVANYPMLWHEPFADRVKVLAKHEMTFSNAGNRSAAIMAVSLYLNRNSPGGGDSNVGCEHGSMASSAAYNIKPFTLAPHEIAVKSVHLVTPDASPDPDDGVELSLRNAGTPPDFKITLSLCMIFSIVTPDAQYRVRKTLGPNILFDNSTRVRANVPRVGETRWSMFEQMRAGQWVLVQSSRTIFSPFAEPPGPGSTVGR